MFIAIAIAAIIVGAYVLGRHHGLNFATVIRFGEKDQKIVAKPPQKQLAALIAGSAIAIGGGQFYVKGDVDHAGVPVSPGYICSEIGSAEAQKLESVYVDWKCDDLHSEDGGVILKADGTSMKLCSMEEPDGGVHELYQIDAGRN